MPPAGSSSSTRAAMRRLTSARRPERAARVGSSSRRSTGMAPPCTRRSDPRRSSAVRSRRTVSAATPRESARLATSTRPAWRASAMIRCCRSAAYIGLPRPDRWPLVGPRSHHQTTHFRSCKEIRAPVFVVFAPDVWESPPASAAGRAADLAPRLQLPEAFRGRSPPASRYATVAVGPACEHGGRGPAECDPGAYPVTTTLALVATLVVLAAVNLWVHVGPSALAAGHRAAARRAACCCSGRWAGLTWAAAGPGSRESRARAGLGRRGRRHSSPSVYAVGALGAGLAPACSSTPGTAVGPLRAARRAFARRATRCRRLRGGGLPGRALGAGRASSHGTLVGGHRHLRALRRSGTCCRRSTVRAPTPPTRRATPLAVARAARAWHPASSPVRSWARWRSHALAGAVFAVLRDQSGAWSRPSCCTGPPTGWASSPPPGPGPCTQSNQ